MGKLLKETMEEVRERIIERDRELLERLNTGSKKVQKKQRMLSEESKAYIHRQRSQIEELSITAERLNNGERWDDLKVVSCSGLPCLACPISIRKCGRFSSGRY